MTLADPRHAAFYEVIWIIWKRTKLHPQPAPVFLKQWGFAQKSGRTKIGDWFSGAFGYITFNILSQKVDLKKAEKHGKGIIPLMRVLSTFAQLPGRRGAGTRPIFGYGWAAEGLKPCPREGQKNPKIFTLFRTKEEMHAVLFLIDYRNRANSRYRLLNTLSTNKIYLAIKSIV